MKKILFFTAISMLILTMSGCSQPEEGSIVVKEAWARSGSIGQNSAIYFEIENRSRNDDSLLSANCQVAKTVELHKTMQESDGIMSMHPQHEVEIPAGEHVSFEPGGLHVMLISLTQDMNTGSTFPLELEFKKSGKLTVQIDVRQP